MHQQNQVAFHQKNILYRDEQLYLKGWQLNFFLLIFNCMGEGVPWYQTFAFSALAF